MLFIIEWSHKMHLKMWETLSSLDINIVYSNKRLLGDKNYTNVQEEEEEKKRK